MSSCLRCGYCCKNHICLVPKYETSNLSPEFLETVDENYIEQNIEEQGLVCKWLKMDETGLHGCTAYERRSSMCRDHNSYAKICPIGLNYWKNKTNIPDEIKFILNLKKS